MEQAVCSQTPCKHPLVVDVTAASTMDALASQRSCRAGTSHQGGFPKDKQSHQALPCWELGQSQLGPTSPAATS